MARAAGDSNKKTTQKGGQIRILPPKGQPRTGHVFEQIVCEAANMPLGSAQIEGEGHIGLLSYLNNRLEECLCAAKDDPRAGRIWRAIAERSEAVALRGHLDGASLLAISAGLGVWQNNAIDQYGNFIKPTATAERFAAKCGLRHTLEALKAWLGENETIDALCKSLNPDLRTSDISHMIVLHSKAAGTTNAPCLLPSLMQSGPGVITKNVWLNETGYLAMAHEMLSWESSNNWNTTQLSTPARGAIDLFREGHLRGWRIPERTLEGMRKTILCLPKDEKHAYVLAAIPELADSDEGAALLVHEDAPKYAEPLALALYFQTGANWIRTAHCVVELAETADGAGRRAIAQALLDGIQRLQTPLSVEFTLRLAAHTDEDIRRAGREAVCVDTRKRLALDLKA